MRHLLVAVLSFFVASAGQAQEVTCSAFLSVEPLERGFYTMGFRNGMIIAAKYQQSQMKASRLEADSEAAMLLDLQVMADYEIFATFISKTSNGEYLAQLERICSDKPEQTLFKATTVLFEERTLPRQKTSE